MLTEVMLGTCSYLCLDIYFVYYIRQKEEENEIKCRPLQTGLSYFCHEVRKPNSDFLLLSSYAAVQKNFPDLDRGAGMSFTLPAPSNNSPTSFLHLIPKPPEAYNQPSYVTAVAPPSNYPPRHFCAVCGFPSNYTCVTCGARYCSVKCLGTHQDTRSSLWCVCPVVVL